METISLSTPDKIEQLDICCCLCYHPKNVDIKKQKQIRKGKPKWKTNLELTVNNLKANLSILKNVKLRKMERGTSEAIAIKKPQYNIGIKDPEELK